MRKFPCYCITASNLVAHWLNRKEHKPLITRLYCKCGTTKPPFSFTLRCSCLCGGERKNALFYWLECGHEKRTNIQLRRAKLSGMTSCGLVSCTLLFYQNLCKFNHHHLVVLLLYLNTINNRDRNNDREKKQTVF